MEIKNENLTFKEKITNNKNLRDETLLETDKYIFKTYPGYKKRQRVIDLMTKYLSEPYPVYTYIYFVDLFPDCTILCYDKSKKDEEGDFYICGAIVGNINEKPNKLQGYIGMLAVETEYRKQKLGTQMVKLLMDLFIKRYHVNELSIETETDNYAALGLYESFGFVRTKMYLNYYFNANSAYKLKLFINN